MQNTTKIKTELHPIIDGRWSPRVFEDRPVQPEQLNRMLEAARSSSSCFNEQPWRFIIGHRGGGSVYQRLLPLVHEGNRHWARKAPLLILLIAKTDFEHNGKNNLWAEYDTGQAAATLTLQAMADNIYIHQMGGFDAGKAHEAFNLGERYRPMAVLAAGYLGDDPRRDEYQQGNNGAARKRLTLDELIMESD